MNDSAWHRRHQVAPYICGAHKILRLKENYSASPQFILADFLQKMLDDLKRRDDVGSRWVIRRPNDGTRA